MSTLLGNLEKIKRIIEELPPTMRLPLLLGAFGVGGYFIQELRTKVDGQEEKLTQVQIQLNVQEEKMSIWMDESRRAMEESRRANEETRSLIEKLREDFNKNASQTQAQIQVLTETVKKLTDVVEELKWDRLKEKAREEVFWQEICQSNPDSVLDVFQKWAKCQNPPGK